MTKFSGDAVGSRSKWVGYTVRNARKDMELYQQTGHHPDVDRLRNKQAKAATPLPDPNPLRHHVFMDIGVQGKPAGRLVIELFDDLAPVPAGALQTRCQPGSSDSFLGTQIHKLVREQAAWGGRSSKHRDRMQMKSNPSLRHSEKGAVSISRSGSEFVLTFQPALHLDETHCVVGRVTAGSFPVLDTLNALRTLPDDSPAQRVTVLRCGSTNAQGTTELVDDDEGKRERDLSPASLQRRVAAEVHATRAEVKDALAEGLSRKRSGADQDDASAKRGRPFIKQKGGMMGELLGVSSNDEESGNDDE